MFLKNKPQTVWKAKTKDKKKKQNLGQCSFSKFKAMSKIN